MGKEMKIIIIIIIITSMHDYIFDLRKSHLIIALWKAIRKSSILIKFWLIYDELINSLATAFIHTHIAQHIAIWEDGEGKNCEWREIFWAIDFDSNKLRVW